MPQTTQRCPWVFTLNNYTDDELSTLQTLSTAEDTPFRYIIWGKEVGENETPHLQGYLELKKKKRLSQLKALLGDRYHFEPRRGTAQQAADYCKKEDDYEEFGSLKNNQGKRTDLESACDDIKNGKTIAEVAVKHSPTFVKYVRGLNALALITQPKYTHGVERGVWFYGKPRTGKSSTARRMYPNAYIKSQNKWFDGYAGESAIILDDLDHGGSCLAHHIKIWTDLHSCTGETKGGTVCLQHRVFIITSNYTPRELFEGDGKTVDEDQINAITERIRFFEFKKELEGPRVGEASEGTWVYNVEPPLPDRFFEEDPISLDDSAGDEDESSI